jgi:uncharacterized protein YbaA (DUF1428 family)
MDAACGLYTDSFDGWSTDPTTGATTMTSEDNETRGVPIEGYVDIYLLPIPARNVDAYQQQATVFGEVVKEHGALSYREFRGDDLGEGMGVEDGELLTAAVVDFESRAHRDDVMGKVMEDPRVAELVAGEQLADMSRMRYGGFETFVNP